MNRIGVLCLLIFGLVSLTSSQTHVSGSINGNVIWDLSHSPYVVVSDVSVEAGATLTIQEGVIVKFQGMCNLNVGGKLVVQGTSGAPVVFTSFQDDSYGGDSNGDLDATGPVPGDWGRINFYNAADITNTLSYCVVKYGGYTNWTGTGNIVVGGTSTVTIQNCQVSQSAWAGIHVSSAKPQILNNIITQNAVGIYCDGVAGAEGSPTIQGNQITNNASFPVQQANLAFPVYNGNTMSGNIYQAIGVGGDLSTEVSATRTWPIVGGLPYVVTGDVSIGEKCTLTLPASVVVKFQGMCNLNVGGKLVVQGTSGAPVVFTSFQDDSYGGDSNGDLDATGPVPGDWGRINFYNAADITNTLSYCVVKYGGYTNWTGTGNIVVGGTSTATIQNCQVSQSAWAGIHVSSAKPQILNNIITQNAVGIYCDGVAGAEGSPTIQGNQITNNASFPVQQANLAFPVYNGNTMSGNIYQAIGVGGDLSTEVSATRTWPIVGGLPYVVTGDVSIGEKCTLTLPASVVVKFQGMCNLNVGGKLVVQGTSGAPVVFTSFQDDSYGGDSNGDLDATGPVPGDWGRINFYNAADITNTLSYCVVKYGGYTNWTGTGNIVVGGTSTVTIQNCQVSQSAWAGIHVSSAKPQILNNIITQNAVGIYCDGVAGAEGSPTIQGNQITNNASFPVQQANLAFPVYNGNTMSGNIYQAIGVGGDLSTEVSATRTWPIVGGLPYVVTGDVSIGEKCTLTLPASVVVKFQGMCNLNVGGKLVVQGTSGAPVVFTSFQDDSYGGDSNGDLDATGPVPGDWGRINFYNAADITNTLSYCVVKYGGYTNWTGTGNIVVGGTSTATIQNCQVSQSAWAGIDVEGAANLKVSYCDIIANAAFGLNNEGSLVVDARNNYWGDPSGPQNLSNPAGKGQPVSSKVLFSPFLTSPSTTNGIVFLALNTIRTGYLVGDTEVPGTSRTVAIIFDFPALKTASNVKARLINTDDNSPIAVNPNTFETLVQYSGRVVSPPLYFTANDCLTNARFSMDITDPSTQVITTVEWPFSYVAAPFAFNKDAYSLSNDETTLGDLKIEAVRRRIATLSDDKAIAVTPEIARQYFKQKGLCYGFSSTTILYKEISSLIPVTGKSTYDLAFPDPGVAENLLSYQSSQSWGLALHAFWNTFFGQPSLLITDLFNQYQTFIQSLESGYCSNLNISNLTFGHTVTGFGALTFDDSTIVLYNNPNIPNFASSSCAFGHVSSPNLITFSFENYRDANVIVNRPNPLPSGEILRSRNNYVQTLSDEDSAVDSLVTMTYKYMESKGRQFLILWDSTQNESGVRMTIVARNGFGDSTVVSKDTILSTIAGSSVTSSKGFVMLELPSKDNIKLNCAAGTNRVIRAEVVKITSKDALNVESFPPLELGANSTFSAQIDSMSAVEHLTVDKFGDGGTIVTITPATSNQITTSISPVLGKMVPTEYALFQNFPNPFNPTTSIRFALPRLSRIQLTVYDNLGREIKKLFDGDLGPGLHEIPFDGSTVASGVYYYRLQAGDFVETKKCLVIK